jgi:seryl-tRNA synthetase
MSVLRVRALLGMLVTAAVAGGVPADVVGAGGAHAQSLQEIRERLEQVRSEQERIQERMAETQQERERLIGEIAALEDELASLEERMVEQQRQLSELDAMITFRVRETFKHGARAEAAVVAVAWPARSISHGTSSTAGATPQRWASTPRTDIMGPHGIPVRAITSGTWHHQRVGPSAGSGGSCGATTVTTTGTCT